MQVNEKIKTIVPIAELSISSLDFSSSEMDPVMMKHTANVNTAMIATIGHMLFMMLSPYSGLNICLTALTMSSCRGTQAFSRLTLKGIGVFLPARILIGASR